VAGENGGSSYPAGTFTVFAGMFPPDGKTMYYEYSAFYTAGELTDSHGKSAVPNFRLTVNANAAEVEHNWGTHVLGGKLLSMIAAPLVYEQIETPGGSAAKANIGNSDLGLATIGYNTESVHLTYGFHIYTPRGRVRKDTDIKRRPALLYPCPADGLHLYAEPRQNGN
jgi:hypothetical protein